MSKDIKKALEHCIDNKCVGCPNNEELGSGDIVCRGRLLPEVLEYVADLEAKLAESEEKVKHWHNLYNERDKQFQSVRQRYHLLNKLKSNYDKKDKLHLAYMQCAELVDENQQLKQQLAEKEKEISNLNGLVRERDKQIKNLKTNKKRVIEHKNKTKISFALEQLEKVKDNINKLPITDITDYGGFKKIYQADATRILDKQINELKGE